MDLGGELEFSKSAFVVSIKDDEIACDRGDIASHTDHFASC